MELAEILSMMKAEETNGDTEDAHGNADDLLIAALRVLADRHPQGNTVGKIIASYGRIDKWFA